MDAERIAALLDGRLDERQRAELLARLDAEPSTLEPFTDAIAVMRELEGGGTAAVTPVVSMEAARRGAGRRPWLAAALAAAAVLVIAAALFLRRAPDRGALESPDVVLARIEAPAGAANATLPDGWQAASWAERRGAAAPLSARSAGVRIGARTVDHELLARSGDAAAPRVAMEIAALLSDLPAGSAAASAWSALADGRSHSAEERQRALRSAEQVAGVEEVRAGAWIEVARFASVRRESTFFRTPKARAAAAELSRIAAGSPAAHELSTRLEAAIAASALDWQALRSTLTDLLRTLGQ